LSQPSLPNKYQKFSVHPFAGTIVVVRVVITQAVINRFDDKVIDDKAVIIRAVINGFDDKGIDDNKSGVDKSISGGWRNGDLC